MSEGFWILVVVLAFFLIVIAMAVDGCVDARKKRRRDEQDVDTS